MSNLEPLQPAYVLHTRAYRDTSLLLELFSFSQGRVSAVARGVRSSKSRFKALLQPFVPLLVSYRGKGDLLNLYVAEPDGISHNLMREELLCGIYLNELLVRLLHRYDAYPNLFMAYKQALMNLQQTNTVQLTLRLFEKTLLIELGYALELDREAKTGMPICRDQFYSFDPAQGLLHCSSNLERFNVFLGDSLLAIQQNQLHNNHQLRDAKRLLRIAINHLLGNKPIRSRELFFN